MVHSDQTHSGMSLIPGLCVLAGVDGIDLSVRGGRVPAHQLLQLQLLAVHRPLRRQPDIPPVQGSQHAPARQGKDLIHGY